MELQEQLTERPTSTSSEHALGFDRVSLSFPPLHGYPVVDKENSEEAKMYVSSNSPHSDEKDNEKQANESTEKRKSIWMWIKANPLEGYVIVTLFTCFIFSLTTFAAKKSGYWKVSYNNDGENSQEIRLAIGYSQYSYDYFGELGKCSGSVSLESEQLVGNFIFAEIAFGMQALQLCSAILALGLIVLRVTAFGEHLSPLYRVVLQRCALGASTVVIIGLFVFFVIMPYDLKEDFLDNFDCLKNHKFIYSDWAANLTIIVIGIWISNAMIFCNYGFWGEVQDLSFVIRDGSTSALMSQPQRSHWEKKESESTHHSRKGMESMQQSRRGMESLHSSVDYTRSNTYPAPIHTPPSVHPTYSHSQHGY